MSQDTINIVLGYLPNLVIAGVILATLHSAHKDPINNFNVFDYFIDNNTGKASITRTLQILAGLTATWVIAKMTATGTLTVEIFGVYLAALGISEGWSKFVGAKWGTKE